MGRIYKRKDSQYWWYTNGSFYKRIQKSTGVRNKKIAQQIADHWDNENALKKVGIAPKNITFKKISELYIKNLYAEHKITQSKNDKSKTSNGKREPTKLKAPKSLINRLHVFFERDYGIKNILVKDITKDMIMEEMTLRLETVTNKTVLNDYVILNQIFDFIVKEGYISHNFVKEIPAPSKKATNPRTAIPYDIVKKAIEKTDNQNDKIFWSLLLYTGLRVGDAMFLEPSDIEDNAIIVTPSKTSKFDTWVDIPLHKKLIEYGIEAICNCMKTTSAKDESLKRFRTILKKIKYKHPEKSMKPDFHSLRHTYHTLLSSSNVPDSVIKLITGHKETKQTRHYISNKVDRYREIIENID